MVKKSINRNVWQLLSWSYIGHIKAFYFYAVNGIIAEMQVYDFRKGVSRYNVPKYIVHLCSCRAMFYPLCGDFGYVMTSDVSVPCNGRPIAVIWAERDLHYIIWIEGFLGYPDNFQKDEFTQRLRPSRRTLQNNNLGYILIRPAT